MSATPEPDPCGASCQPAEDATAEARSQGVNPVTRLQWRTYSSGGVNHHTTEVCSDHERIYSEAAGVLGVILRGDPVKAPCGACAVCWEQS